MGCGGVFEASVFSGRGEGGFYVSIYSREFRRLLGINPYPGTLNTRLTSNVEGFNRCLEGNGILVRPPKIPGARLGDVYVYPAVIEGSVEAFIVRPVITFYSSDVVEFISSEYIRGRLSLRDGDRVRFRLKL